MSMGISPGGMVSFKPIHYPPLIRIDIFSIRVLDFFTLLLPGRIPDKPVEECMTVAVLHGRNLERSTIIWRQAGVVDQRRVFYV